jgi:hypothetical protein
MNKPYFRKPFSDAAIIQESVDYLNRRIPMPDQERSDKGTVRELTDIAQAVREARTTVLRAITNRLGQFSDLTDDVESVKAFIKDEFDKLEKEVRSYDQRDRLEKDKEN